MAPTNKAAWLMEKKGRPFKIDEAPMPHPGPNQMTIRVRAVAINPVDAWMQALGLIRETFPCILGVDAAGEVVEVGEKVTSFSVGDRVIGLYGEHSNADFAHATNGCFQLYCNLNDNMAAKIPDHVEFKDGVVIPLGLCTAAVAMFEDYNLNWPYPQLSPKPNGKTVLIWGGASSVGTCGIQAAKAAGFEVAATASSHNHEYLKSIGTDYVFDYKSETLVEDVTKALKGKDFDGVFDAVFGEETYIKSAEICIALGGKQFVSTVLTKFMPYEKELPGGVQIGYTWGDSLRDTPVGPAIWSWVEGALANGTLKCKPDAHVVGQGLEAIQEACDLMMKGASARKYVVEIP